MSPVISIDTDKSLARIREDLPRACADHGFGVLNVHDLQQRVRAKGLELEYGTLVFDVCHPHHATKLLDHHMELATALPCRIAAFELPEGGRTRIAILRPTEIFALYGALEIGGIAADIERTLRAIIDEAAH